MSQAIRQPVLLTYSTSWNSVQTRLTNKVMGYEVFVASAWYKQEWKTRPFQHLSTVLASALNCLPVVLQVLLLPGLHLRLLLLWRRPPRRGLPPRPGVAEPLRRGRPVLHAAASPRNFVI